MELLAITGRLASNASAIPHKHCRESRRNDLYMRVEDERLVDSYFFDHPDLTLICRADLLTTESITNVAAHFARLYREQGDRFVSDLRGTFAIVLYDHTLRTLKAWIDHFGAERLVFAELGNSVAISTDIRSLPGHNRRVSPAAVQEYLQYTCIPAPKTIYEGISKLTPGSQLTSHPKLTTSNYWNMAYDERASVKQSQKVWADSTRDAVRSAVAVTLETIPEVSFTPGCFLSGGTDSSSVAGFVGQLTGRAPRTFSIGFDDPRYNEIGYARIAAKHFSADHHEYFVKPDDIPNLVEKAVRVYDEPFGNSSIVPTYYCARLAAEHGVTHLLAGDGGDELFGGNARYGADQLFQRYFRLPSLGRKWLLEPALSTVAPRIDFRLLRLAANYVRRSNIPVPDRYFSYSLISSVPGHEIFTRDFLDSAQDHDSLTIARTHFRNAPARTDLNRWLYLDLKMTIGDNDLRKVMTMSRLAGVTPRFPLLDPTLALFSGKIPADLKVRGTELRYLFKKAMQEVLPPDIITKSKHGFGLPYAVWLGDSRRLRDFTFDILSSEKFRQRGYFRAGLVDWLWSQYLSVHRGYYGEILWILLMFELWHVTQADQLRNEEPRLAAISQIS